MIDGLITNHGRYFNILINKINYRWSKKKLAGKSKKFYFDRSTAKGYALRATTLRHCYAAATMLREFVAVLSNVAHDKGVFSLTRESVSGEGSIFYSIDSIRYSSH